MGIESLLGGGRRKEVEIILSKIYQKDIRMMVHSKYITARSRKSILFGE